MTSPTLKFKKLHPNVILPKTWSDIAVGYDLHAWLPGERGLGVKQLIPPRTTRNIPTGLLVESPPGYFLMVCSRSGFAVRSVFVTNSPGIIDPDYRGEIRVMLYNGSHESQYIEHGTRIAQLVVMPVTQVTIVEVAELTETRRGEAGFGSTGA